VTGHNFIDIKFAHLVFPFRIHIYETYNPGGVVAIWAGDAQVRDFFIFLL
jgi:F-box/leucine-rich repeat protein 4